MNLEMIQFDEKGLVPAIVQDAASKEVLTLAYMNKESLTKTIETKETWFYSRSREELWHKGETSGNTQTVSDLRYDCDQDAVLVLVKPAGPACHKGDYTCFSDSLLGNEVKADENRFAILNTLEEIIAKRDAERPEGAYTTYLFTEGVDKILKKVGEEASEVIIAAKNRDLEELTWESADLLFHLMVLLREQECPLDDVLNVLEKRHASK
ncbi:bifunctional phosphoribosyl-AMP cyclohydrolase/phosphoribosyl-ATP diphosphatase HisIE [Bacillus sp. NTK071]|uniref:bifunctional phosphoribosyl-AMP cyclohydrolase/phosphoribosyl-ATP diphosphatase HisIE n=1 Tax=Bacillus sp. NTK071 TaxID=2802175 RepID=UPI001A8D715A|nr:bifunctional phosphoribosyl-AMP cyclohydrolase/phosphoribosyl-ATP diphosphatase HisIE [Bacillus sp. NTK071]MBN8210036.1 bifunctional phosphoribosyl-AMP cyclohydrolase/phosphoribosyl-ATP diphosphatase HisIE [Bacillus sp. NTK071]